MANAPRTLLEEDQLADRVAYERERRGWTYEGLALRMTQIGCPINQSALYKVEKASPRRRITVAELVALARVFGVGVEELLTPVELLKNSRAKELADKLVAADFGHASLGIKDGAFEDNLGKAKPENVDFDPHA